MANFPTTTPTFRPLENLPHVTYDPAQKKTIYAEDMTQLQSELLAVMSYVQQLRTELDTEKAKQEYKVGDIFLSFNATNPATVKGYGTWALVSSGRTLVGVDAAQTEFNTVRKTGGHKLLQSHKHDIYTWVGNAQTGATNLDDIPGSANHNTASEVVFGHGTEFTGGGNAQNLQPYLTCYIWERTA